MNILKLSKQHALPFATAWANELSKITGIYHTAIRNEDDTAWIVTATYGKIVSDNFGKK
jgi:hypothetical protein